MKAFLKTILYVWVLLRLSLMQYRPAGNSGEDVAAEDGERLVPWRGEDFEEFCKDDEPLSIISGPFGRAAEMQVAGEYKQAEQIYRELLQGVKEIDLDLYKRLITSEIFKFNWRLLFTDQGRNVPPIP